MTITSHMATAEDGLLALLQASSVFTTPTLASPGGVPVQLGDPGAQPPAEIVWIAEDAQGDWTPEVTAAVPPPTMDEVYLLNVKILVFQSGDGYKAARDRANALAAGVELAVVSDPSLGGAVVDGYVTQVRRQTGSTDTGRGIEMTVQVRLWSYLA